MVHIEHLQLYLAHGFRLFPCRSADKTPYTNHGFKDASDNLDVITKWYHQYPECAWGTPTSSQYSIVDIDPRNGGDAAWEKLIAEHGDIPPCPTVETGSGGTHYVMGSTPGTRCGKIGAGIDLKADGGYVIVPPSRIHDPEGRHFQPYRWLVKAWEIAIPQAPSWLVALRVKGSGLSPASRATASPAPDAYTLETHPGSPEGERRLTLCRLVGTALGMGVHPDTVWVQAEAWAERCTPYFGDWEKHVRGLVNREREKVNNNSLLFPSPNPLPLSLEAGKEGTNYPPPDAQGGVSSFPAVSSLSPTPDPAEGELVPSFPVSGDGGAVNVKGGDVVRDDPFALHPDAYHGVLGAVVNAVAPHTEADNPALLVCLLTAFGNAVGFGPHFDHGKRHGCNLFAGLVGATASRKGTATGIAKRIIADADPEWEHRVQHEGFGSGEGLIWSVRDPNPNDPVGIQDKRLLVIEEEWAKTFTLSASDKSILTPIIRGCYDRIPIGKKNKGDNAYGCREPHVSIIGNITPDDLRQSLTGKMAVSIANGFLNRFLLVATRRTKFLPRGGKWKEHAQPLIPTVRDAIARAKTRTLMGLDGEAEGFWDSIYSTLETRPEGVPGAVTGRASDMAMKLALVYALADGDDAIRVAHLRAGLAVWRYCEATAFALFGMGDGKGVREANPSPEPDPLWLQLMNAITASPGVSRSELVRAFRHPADAIGVALEGVRVKGMAFPVAYQNPNGGPKGEKWYPGSDGGDGETPNNINKLSPSPDTLPLPVELTPPEGTNSPGGGMELVPSGGCGEGVGGKVRGSGEDVVQLYPSLQTYTRPNMGVSLTKTSVGKLVGKIDTLRVAFPLLDTKFRDTVAAEYLTNEEFESEFREM